MKGKNNQSKKIHFKIDTDRDGVPDWKDCRPFNPFKQHLGPAHPDFQQRDNESDKEWTVRVLHTINKNALKQVDNDSFYFRTMVTVKHGLDKKGHNVMSFNFGEPPLKYIMDKETKTKMKINYNVVGPINRRLIAISDPKEKVTGYADIIGVPILLFLITDLDKEKLGPMFYPFLMNVLQYDMYRRMSR